MLEDHRDPAPPGVEQRLVRHRGDVLAVQLHRAGGGLDQPGEQADQGRLARAGQAHHHEHLTRRDVEPDVPDADDVAGLLLQLLARELGLVGLHDLVGPRPEDLPETLDMHRWRLRAPVRRHRLFCRSHARFLAVAAVAGWVERISRAVAIEGHAGGGQGCVAGDQVGRLLGDHHHRGIDVAVGDEGEDGGIDDAEPVDAVDLHRVGIDDGHLVDAHLGGARGVQRGLRVGAHPVEDLLVGLDRGRRARARRRCTARTRAG